MPKDGERISLPDVQLRGRPLPRVPRSAEVSDGRQSSIRRDESELSTKVKTEPFQSSNEEKHDERTNGNENRNDDLANIPDMTPLGSGKTYKRRSRKMPESRKRVPPEKPEPKIKLFSGRKVFLELLHVIELQKLGYLMEQEMVNRFKILQKLDGAQDGLPKTTRRRKDAKSTGILARHYNGGQITIEMTIPPEEDDAPNEEQPQEGDERDNPDDHDERDDHDDPDERDDRDRLLVLRPDLVVPELRDLPSLGDMVTVPSTLNEAVEMIFALRKNIILLRNSMLKRALAKSEERIESCKSKPRDKTAEKQEALLNHLSTVFSRSQLAFFRQGKKCEPWMLEDYLQAIELRSLCRRRAFEYVRSTMKIPLPSMNAVRSMAYCGLMPEVTRRYKDLAKSKNLKVDIPLKKKPTILGRGEDGGGDASHAEQVDDELVARAAYAGHGARTAAKRKRMDDDYPELQPDEQRLYLDFPPVEMMSESGTSDEESESESDDSERPVPQARYRRNRRSTPSAPYRPRGRGRRRGWGRGRGRNRQQAQHSVFSVEWMEEERGSVDLVGFASNGEADDPSDDGYEQGDAVDVSFSQEAPVQPIEQEEYIEVESLPPGWEDAQHPPQPVRQEWLPRQSPRQKKGKRYASIQGLVRRV